MNTPNTEAGRITEKIMLSIKAQLPDIKAVDYNRIYESVENTMKGELQFSRVTQLNAEDIFSEIAHI